MNHRIACNEAFFQRFFYAFFDSRDILARHSPAEDSIDKFEVFPVGKRFQFEFDMTILAMTTALFLMFAFYFRNTIDGFSVRNIDRFEDSFDAVFAFHLVHDVFQMDVAHAADEYLLAFGILFHLAGRIFFTDFRQRRHQFFFVAFLFRNHGNCMERIGEADRIVFYREFCRSKGITCTSMGQFRNDDDITGNSFFDWYLFFADEGKHLAQFFFRILGHIIQLIPFFEFTGENADVTQFSCKGIDECLKYKSRERLVGIYHDRFARLFIRSHHDFLGYNG